ncbi:hypothetical protein GGI20_000025 [Coemansia sp. BCRC 34301]|nr:hypothetical protein GGI20_000025 [Coemansia sp. BCRC 34301]
MLSESGHKYSPERPADDRGKDDDDEDNVQSVQKRQRGRQITVRIELPFADEHGDTLFGTAQSTNQADAERLACLDALEELDKRGYLNTDSGHREDDICLQEKEEDDDFYDQTKPKSSARNSENGVETFETLSRKVQQVCEEIGRVNRELAALSSASELIPNATDEEDELDAYMNTLARGETADSQRRLLAELEDLVAQKTRLDALLRIVEPDRSDASSVPSHPSASAHAITPAITPAITLAITPAGSTQSTKRRMVHRPPREEASNNVKPSKHAKTDIDSDDANISWQPPANQSGDGRTSLNEKLGY